MTSKEKDVRIYKLEVENRILLKKLKDLKNLTKL